jgi:hypothetical protein
MRQEDVLVRRLAIPSGARGIDHKNFIGSIGRLVPIEEENASRYRSSVEEIIRQDDDSLE